jgi:CRP/FNR family cyclic AMP-dependent transcriptional regulator
MALDGYGLYPALSGTSLFDRVAPRARSASLVDLDPSLFDGVSPRELRSARDIGAHVIELEPGRWEPNTSKRDAALGLLVIDGLLARTVAVDREVAIELVGPGDLIRPWEAGQDEDLLVPCPVGWIVLQPTRIAMLGRQVAAAAADSPALVMSLLERTARRTRSQGIVGAIAHLRHIDLRILVLLTHLAERWGRVTPDGIVVPLQLTHRRIAMLVGAQRPTVTAALSRMAAESVVVRTPERGFLLTDRARERLNVLCSGGESAAAAVADGLASG